LALKIINEVLETDEVMASKHTLIAIKVMPATKTNITQNLAINIYSNPEKFCNANINRAKIDAKTKKYTLSFNIGFE
jgi:hypothetical protein